MESFKMPINPNPLEKQPTKEPQVREGTQERICPECMVALDASDVCHSLSCENLNKKVLEPIVVSKEGEPLELSGEEIFEGEIPAEKIHDIELSNAADKMVREIVDFTHPEFYKVAGVLNYEKTKKKIASLIEGEIAARGFNTPGKIIEFMETLVSYGTGFLNSHDREQSTPERNEIVQMTEKALREILEDKKAQFKMQRVI